MDVIHILIAVAAVQGRLRAWPGVGDALVVVQAAAGHEPAVVLAHSLDEVATGVADVVVEDSDARLEVDV